MSDAYDLQRFVDAQACTYVEAYAELRAGHKRGHWMWFVFPQIAGLGSSVMSRRYAIASLHEARAYLAHPILGARLRACAGLLARPGQPRAREILGSPDDRKLRSSMTLFALATEDAAIFEAVLEHHFGARQDERTVELLRAMARPEHR
jgi:uncharacterized protein (DUF1810 family)